MWFLAFVTTLTEIPNMAFSMIYRISIQIALRLPVSWICCPMLHLLQSTVCWIHQRLLQLRTATFYHVPWRTHNCGDGRLCKRHRSSRWEKYFWGDALRRPTLPVKSATQLYSPNECCHHWPTIRSTQMLTPVPSPVVVPSFNRLRWWIWFWMFVMIGLSPDAPAFTPMQNNETLVHTCEHVPDRNNRGEGRLVCVDQSEIADDLLQELIHSFVVNSHINGPPGPDKTRKRSWMRACRRALRDGYSWYRGQLLSKCQVPTHMLDRLTSTDCATTRVNNPEPCLPTQSAPTNQNRNQTPRNRLLILQWNVGGLSSSRYHELCHWLEVQQISIALIQETRWRNAMEWQDSKWIGIHSGDAKESAGVMMLIRKHVISQANLAWQEIVPGRVLHVRLHGRVRHYDILNVYQYTYSKPNLDLRKQILAKLLQTIERLPRRNQFFMGGDFNCHLPRISDLTGTDYYVWQRLRAKETQHADSDVLQNLVVKMGLAALNTWNPRLGPTFVRRASVGSFHSRTDFGFMRATAADGISKQPVNLADFPMLSDTGHYALLSSVPKTWQAHKSATADARFTYQQRLHARCVRLNNDTSWTDYVQTTQLCLRQLDLVKQAQDGADPLQYLRDTMADNYHCYLPKPSAAATSDRILPRPQVMRKWEHYKAFKRPTVFNLRSLFHCWKHWSRFNILDKQQALDLKMLTRQRLETMMQSAQQAADRHDLFGLHKILNQCCPKQRRVRFQLRHSDGRLAP